MGDPVGGHDSQLLRGVLPLLILTLLDERESYGYELVERLRELGLAGLATGVVYPVLGRFERDHLVTSRLVASSSGPARRYYAITEHGRSAQMDAAAKWTAIARIAERGLDRKEKHA
ncbi:PadR family transcriptional regulator [Microbacterium sp. X-17]|uniref:PadR family transcriptional regulator n=1 Tax=Microbacterium sp. X-17 TaxID=3144404 RepID=UPI0031F5B52A